MTAAPTAKSHPPDEWEPLRTFRAEMLTKVLHLRRVYKCDSESQGNPPTTTSSTAQTQAKLQRERALRRTADDFEFKFKQLALSTFFEKSFAYIGVTPSQREVNLANAAARAAERDALNQLINSNVTSTPEADREEDENSVINVLSPPRLDDAILLLDLLPNTAEPRSETSAPASVFLKPDEPPRSMFSNEDAQELCWSKRPRATTMLPVCDFSLPRKEIASDVMRYARAIGRGELLQRINRFFETIGLLPINKRDAIWRVWFLREYLDLTDEEIASCRPLLMMDKRSRESFAQTIAKLHEETRADLPVVTKRARCE